MISKIAKTEIVKPESSAVFLHLLKVEAQGYETLYFVDNTQSIVSNGQTYVPAAFKVVLPSQTEDGSVQPCQLVVDNVDQIISATIKKANAAQKKIYATISVVMAQTPDIIERGPLRFILRDVTINKSTVSGELYDFYVYDRKIPEGVYNPQNFPGLF